MSKIVITLCTAKRPKMLKNCLDSLEKMFVPEGVAVSIAICENGPEASAHNLVSEFETRSGIKTIYEIEPEIGIPFARNKTLEMALAAKADWIIFIDDDERVEQDWLIKFWQAAQSFKADIYKGPVRKIFPKNAPQWVDTSNKVTNVTGTTENSIYTSNTMMAARIAEMSGLSLRFDESLRYSGGSDTEFFDRAISKGAVAVSVEDAWVEEDVPFSRMTLKWNLQRAYRVSANYGTRRKKKKHYAVWLSHMALKFVTKIASGIVNCVFAVLITLINPSKAKKIGFIGLRNLYEAAGYIAAVFGITPEPYRVIDGY